MMTDKQHRVLNSLFLLVLILAVLVLGRRQLDQETQMRQCETMLFEKLFDRPDPLKEIR